MSKRAVAIASNNCPIEELIEMIDSGDISPEEYINYLNYRPLAPKWASKVLVTEDAVVNYVQHNVSVCSVKPIILTSLTNGKLSKERAHQEYFNRNTTITHGEYSKYMYEDVYLFKKYADKNFGQNVKTIFRYILQLLMDGKMSFREYKEEFNYSEDDLKSLKSFIKLEYGKYLNSDVVNFDGISVESLNDWERRTITINKNYSNSKRFAIYENYFDWEYLSAKDDLNLLFIEDHWDKISLAKVWLNNNKVDFNFFVKNAEELVKNKKMVYLDELVEDYPTGNVKRHVPLTILQIKKLKDLGILKIRKCSNENYNILFKEAISFWN